MDNRTDNRGRQQRYYIVKRIEESFQVLAIDKDDAARLCQDPFNVRVIKETIKLAPK